MQNKHVKLIIGIISHSRESFEKSIPILKRAFGPIDYTSKELDFNHTDYYKKDMGTGLKRYFLSFSRLIDPNNLPAIKRKTIDFEKRISGEIKSVMRPINLDPGYIDAAKLILASTKDYYHRIFIGKEIYGELTLSYRKSSFVPMEWTYYDYKNKDCIEVFNHIRSIFMEQRGITQKEF